MLPELIYREERSEDYLLLVALGMVSALIGFGAASFLFPTETDILAVIFASVPLVYPLTKFFLEDEKNRAPHIPEIQVYGSIFVGEVIGFIVLGTIFPESFSIQSSIVGASGFAIFGGSFIGILLNNLTVFGAILGLAAIIGSAGAFVLTWNASVLGVFFAKLLGSIESGAGYFTCKPTPSPLCYAPHTFFEMTGFIIAGVSGSLISAAVYREHFDKETWKDYSKLVALGLSMILLGAFLESA
jgi:hypothetical protein